MQEIQIVEMVADSTGGFSAPTYSKPNLQRNFVWVLSGPVLLHSPLAKTTYFDNSLLNHCCAVNRNCLNISVDSVEVTVTSVEEGRLGESIKTT